MRECGDCTACCTALLIDVGDIKSNAYEPCKHLTAKGCGIYKDRPENPCRSFSCAWLQGHMEEKDRPDRSGGIVWQTIRDGERITLVSEVGGMEPSYRVLKFALGCGTRVELEVQQ